MVDKSERNIISCSLSDGNEGNIEIAEPWVGEVVERQYIKCAMIATAINIFRRIFSIYGMFCKIFYEKLFFFFCFYKLCIYNLH